MLRATLHWTVPVLRLGWLCYWLIEAGNTAPTAKSESLLTGILYRGATILGVLLIASVKLSKDHFWPVNVPLLCMGVLLMICGFSFAIWARRHLGRYWSSRVTLKQGHQVVDSGPYSIVRHPIYSGLLLSLAGTVLTIGTVQSLCGYVVIVLALALKMAAEERLLITHLGQAYQDYRKRVKALIPGVF
jgi:protein-S-isoprenylcysteine O-methyltransferase Ste14